MIDDEIIKLIKLISEKLEAEKHGTLFNCKPRRDDEDKNVFIKDNQTEESEFEKKVNDCPFIDDDPPEDDYTIELTKKAYGELIAKIDILQNTCNANGLKINNINRRIAVLEASKHISNMGKDDI